MKIEWTVIFLESLLKKPTNQQKIRSVFCRLKQLLFVYVYQDLQSWPEVSVGMKPDQLKKINKMNKYRYLNIKQTIQSYISAQKCFVVVMLL